jgi:hypothetical protein
MTTQVTIKNHGPDIIDLTLIEHIMGQEKPVMVKMIALEPDSEETLHIWGTREFKIRERQ